MCLLNRVTFHWATLQNLSSNQLALSSRHPALGLLPAEGFPFLGAGRLCHRKPAEINYSGTRLEAAPVTVGKDLALPALQLVALWVASLA